MTLDEALESIWPVINIRSKTLEDYKRLYRKNFHLIIGHLEISEITGLQVQQRLLQLPPQTSRHCLMLLKTIYREAKLHGLTDTNPTVGLRTPAIQMTSKKFLTWDEVNERDWGRYNNHIRFLALHGLRWSEAAVLNESDIHDGFVWVNRTIHGQVKSKSSIRKIPYLGFFEKFPATYKPLQKTANLHGVTVHSFRRTYAYLLKTEGIHVTTAQKLLGHSDPLMTLKVYTSVLDDEIELAGQKLNLKIKA